MKLIKIINGTYGHRPEPYTVEPKTAEDTPFEVSDSEAARLVELGIAAIVFGEGSDSFAAAMDGMVGKLGDQPEPPADPEDDNEAESEQDQPEPEEDPVPAYTRETLEKMHNPELAELSKELGATVKGRPTKDELITAILAALEEDEELPDLGAVDPEV